MAHARPSIKPVADSALLVEFEKRIHESISQDVLDSGRHLMRMQGREIFKNAVRSMAEASHIALHDAGFTV